MELLFGLFLFIAGTALAIGVIRREERRHENG